MIATDQPMGPGRRWIELRVAHSMTRVVLFTPECHEDGIGTFFNGSLACDDVEATCRRLAERGVEIVQPPTPQSWGTFAKIPRLRRQYARPNVVATRPAGAS